MHPIYCYGTHQCGCSTVHSTALRASMCCMLVYMALMLCPWEIRLLSPTCHMRVAVDQVWLEHGVM